MKVLFVGPPGSGKSYLSKKLREKGISAIDGDEQLGYWVDGKGIKVSNSSENGIEFYQNHKYLYDADKLESILNSSSEIIVFGSSSNIFELSELFDKVYFLDVDREVQTSRLASSDRRHPLGFGKKSWQRDIAIERAAALRQRASELGWKMVNASSSPEKVMKLLGYEDKHKNN